MYQWDLEDDGAFETFTALVNTTTNQVEYLADARSIAAIQLPNSGNMAIVVHLEEENAIAVIGETGGTIGAAGSHGSEQFFTSTGDYQLELKFQAEPGLRLAYDPDQFDPRYDMDIDGDQFLDIPMIIQDESNEPTGVIVRGGDSFGVLWEFPFSAAYKENILKGFFGFVDANGDGEKEAILGENLAVTLDGTVHVIADNFVTLDVNDVNGDGYEDIIGINTIDSTIVVYGAMTVATTVEDYNSADIHYQLFQNYPNPFNTGTTITYAIEQPAEIVLTVHNILGQEVRTLFRGLQEKGNYSFGWDGKDNQGRRVSSGSYFYRVKAGLSVQTRHMILLK